MAKGKKNRFILVASVVSFVLVGFTTGIAKTEDEENNISIYRRVGPGVVNITSVVVERNFFFNPIPTLAPVGQGRLERGRQAGSSGEFPNPGGR